MELFAKIFCCCLAVGCLFLTSLGWGGNTILLLLCVCYAALDGFYSINLGQLSVIAVFYIFGEVWDFILSYLGIKKEKVSWPVLLIIGVGSFTGAVFGTAVLPVAGSLLGAATGAFATAFGCEYFLSRQRGRALRIAWAAAKNHLWGMLGKLLAGIIMFLLLARALFIL